MRKYRRQQIEHVKRIMKMPRYIIDVLVDPNWPRIKKEWAEYDKTFRFGRAPAPKIDELDRNFYMLESHYNNIVIAKPKMQPYIFSELA